MKEKLLVLDDEELILASIESLFEDDYDVFTATDAETARGLALQHDIAVILCDERMPKVTGHEFLERVKEVSAASRVMMSGYADIAALTEAVNSGKIFAYIAKPWSPPKLKAQVAAAVVHFKLIQEVEHERELLRALMENIPDLIYFKDPESCFTRVNEAHARNLGAKDSKECIGKRDSDYFEASEAARWRLEEKEIVRSGLVQIDLVEQVKDSRGDLHWWSTTKVPMFDRSGNVSGIAGISRDVTALKAGDALLREELERSRMILETAHDAFIGMDPDGSITAWNPQAERTFGWAAAEILGRRLCDTVIAPEYREAHEHGLEHFLSIVQGSLFNQVIELVGLHRDGHEFPVVATIWPVRVGGVSTFNAFARDVSEEQRAAEARRKETARIKLLQSVTVAANGSSTIVDTALACLDKICSQTGWPLGHVYLPGKDSPDELISAGFWLVEDDGRFAAFREASDRSGVAATGLSGRVLASGEPEWIVNLADNDPQSERTRAAEQAGLRSGFGFPVVVEQKIIGVLEFFSLHTVQPDNDFLSVLGQIGSQLGQVMVRQRAEEHLQLAKASAESANRAKSEFLTTMSHEMRNPMNAILGMADLLSESPLRDDQRDYVQIFQKAGANLLDLINDILDLSKVESGHIELESIGFDLGVHLERIIELMVSRAHDRGLMLTLEVLPDVPLSLIGDPKRLQQILVNLIGNALKFTEQGSVTLRVEREPEGVPGWLRFSVKDTGIGIAAEKTEMIFEKFTQADSSTTRKYGGTGLGLAISRGLAELMGGRIGCRSEVGKGSTFFLSAPFAAHVAVAPAAAEPAAKSSGAAGPPAGTRILIVEDSRDNLLLMKAYLKDTGFELDFAENGKIAVEKVMSGNPSLVLMDLQMPVMGGLEATRAIRQWEAMTNAHPVPILALTAHAGAEGVARSLEAGCMEHLTKPIKKSTLLEAIYRHTGGTISITPPEGIESLVPKYLENVRRDMSEILAGVESKNCEVARFLGHQFKGSGEGYGFPEITRAGAALEVAAMNANEDEIRRQVLALANYLDRVTVVV